MEQGKVEQVSIGQGRMEQVGVRWSSAMHGRMEQVKAEQKAKPDQVSHEIFVQEKKIPLNAVENQEGYGKKRDPKPQYRLPFTLPDTFIA